MLAAHRGTADAAGVDWKSAVYRKVKEEMKAGSGLTVERMMRLGRVSRASFYRFEENAPPSCDAEMDLRDAVHRIALNSIGPEFGRFGGGAINMTTKSGTNQFHRSLYEYLRNADLNANNFFNNANGQPRGKWNQNQFGAKSSRS